MSIFGGGGGSQPLFGAKPDEVAAQQKEKVPVSIVSNKTEEATSKKTDEIAQKPLVSSAS